MMWKCKWLLYLVVLGLATPQVSSMNDQTSSKNDSQKLFSSHTNSDDKRKQHDEVKDREQLVSNTVSTTDPNPGRRDSLGFNSSAALVPDFSGSSVNAVRSGSHEQSHSKHHLRRSKSYRKETKIKSRAGSVKNNTASGNMIPFGFEHVGVQSQEDPNTSNLSSDSSKLMDSTPKTFSTSPFIKSNSSRGSKDANNRKLDNLSSRVTTSSGSTENWNTSSSSSDTGSAIDEKTSSIELMAFTFDNVDTAQKSTLTNETTNRVANSNTSIKEDDSLSRIRATTQKLDKSTDNTESKSTEVNSGSVADNLKNLDLQEGRGYYLYGNSTASLDPDGSSSSRIQTRDTVGDSVKHSRSSTVLEVPQSTKILHPAMSSASEVTFSDNSQSFSSSSSTKKDEQPFRITIPLNIESIVQAGKKNNSATENVELAGRSNSEDFSFRKRSLRLNESSRLVTDLNPSSLPHSSNSSFEGIENARLRPAPKNPFVQRSVGCTVSVSGNNISASDQCLTQQSSAQVSTNMTSRPEVISSSITHSNSDQIRYSIGSNGTEAYVTESSFSEINDHRGGQSLLSSSFIVLEDLEPIVYEMPHPEEDSVAIDTEQTTPAHFSAGSSDLEEHCDSASFIFIPSLNSSEIEAKDIPTLKESSQREHLHLNITATEDSLYIMDGFEFLENSADEVPRPEDEFDHRRHAAFDYGEIEANSGYPQFGNDSSAIELIDQIEFEAKLPMKQDPLLIAGLEWKGNDGNDQIDYPWWLRGKTELRNNEPVNNDDSEHKTVLIATGLGINKDNRPIPSLFDNFSSQHHESENNSSHIFVLPTVYIILGISVLIVGCGIWCSKALRDAQPKPCMIKYSIQQKRGASNAVV